MNRKILTGILAALGMLILILDAKTALTGAQAGLELCLRSVIPSLLPFFILSALLTGSLTGIKIPGFSLLGRLTGMPKGSEAILLTGLLGGYPAGAQCIADACSKGRISSWDGCRMLGFCSNAGPSFIFGMVAGRFMDSKIGWLLWGIQILSCLLTGFLLPGKSRDSVCLRAGDAQSFSGALQSSIKVLAGVCGWVILFRVILGFLERWVLWAPPTESSVLAAGLLELTNGCWQLMYIPDEALRMCMAAGMLSFGGLCVLMQTVSVTATLGLGMYIPGKILQTSISVALALILSGNVLIGAGILLFVSILAAILGKIKNNSGNLQPVGV